MQVGNSGCMPVQTGNQEQLECIDYNGLVGQDKDRWANGQPLRGMVGIMG